MERKIYVKPEMTVTVMESTALMAAVSGGLNPSQTNGTLGVGTTVDTDKNSWADSKRYNVWEDDDEAAN